MKRNRREQLAGLLLGLGALALYVATAAPSVATVFDDSLEFQVVLPSLGIAHPSGYPLYTLLGKASTLLIPFRDVAGRTNLFSALCGAAAVAAFYFLALALAKDWRAALVSGMSFALLPAWWSQAIIAEVYSLHGLLLALFLLFCLRWEERRAAQMPEGSYDRRLLLGAALLFGLGMAHHRMIALAAPAAALLLIWAAPTAWRRPWERWPVALAVAAPLLLYLYLPLRGQVVSSLDGTYVPTVEGTIAWIAARAYNVFLTGNPFGVERDAGFFVQLATNPLGVPLVLLVLLGVSAGVRFGTRRFLFLLLLTVTHLVFAVLYKVQDVEVFFIPVFMCLLLWAAWGAVYVFDSGAALLAGWMRRLAARPRSARPLLLAWNVVALALLLAAPVGQAIAGYAKLDRSSDWGAYDYGLDMVAHVAPGGRVVGLLGETTLIRYFAHVLGRRPDISLAPADSEEQRFRAVEEALAQGIPVYLTRDLPGAAGRYSLDAKGPLIAVNHKQDPPVGAAAAPVASAAGLELLHAEPALRETHGGQVLRVTATWRAPRPVQSLKVSMRVQDERGAVLASDDRIPVHFAYPTDRWLPGEQVTDVYDLPLAAQQISGARRLLIVLYEPASGKEVGRIELPLPALQTATVSPAGGR